MLKEKLELPSNLTSREMIDKYCKVGPASNGEGEIITLGEKRYRTVKSVKDMSDIECDNVCKLFKLGEPAGGILVRHRQTRDKIAGRKLCECGCGQVVRATSQFLQGHDAKLKSRLRKTISKGGRASVAAREQLAFRKWV